MDDLEDIMDKIHECKVDFKDDELYHFLCEEICHVSEIPDDREDIFEATYDALRDKLIDVYTSCLKLYYRNDEDLTMQIDRERSELRFVKQRK